MRKFKRNLRTWMVNRWLHSKKGRPMLKWLEGKKQIIVSVLGAIALLLPAVGIAPDSVAALTSLQAAIQSGNWGAALTTLVSAIALLVSAAHRAYQNRTQK